MLKKFSQWLGGLASPGESGGAPCAQLCLFGKHPGWDDHMQDLGLHTQRLVETRRTLYAEGIAGNIDNGAWEKLGGNALPGFDHAFVWRFKNDEFVYGRFWASSDARGRKKYPMVACVHARGYELAKMAAMAAESVTRVMEGCRQETDGQAVRSLFLRESEGLLARATNVGPAGSDRFDRGCRAALEGDADLTRNGQEALVRAAYGIHREAEPLLKRGASQSSRGVHFRLPRVKSMGIGSSAWAWTSGVQDLLGRPEGLVDGILALESVAGGWVDVLIGRVSVAELVCLRAMTGAIPLTTDVPFTIDAAFADRVRSRVSQWKQAPTPERPGAIG